MSGKAIDVQRWPACGKNVPPVDGLIVVAVDTPLTPIREAARKLVRDAAREILGNFLDCPPASVNVLSQPGQAPRLAGHDDIHLSISHEPGLSLLAINLQGAVGVDLLRITGIPDWQADILVLARDYLTPGTAEKLATISLNRQAVCFAEAWTHHEAHLKYLGQELTEWQPDFAQRFSKCRIIDLHLPRGYYGALATAG